MRSDRMRYLREDRGKLVRDGASQRFGGALPDALGSDEHASTPLLSVRVISSRMASMVSLLAISPGGRDARLVAAIGSLSSICPRSTTSMLSPPLGFGLRPDASAIRRPKSGCLGSVTSITPPSAGFWKGVSTKALVQVRQLAGTDPTLRKYKGHIANVEGAATRGKFEVGTLVIDGEGLGAEVHL